VSENTTLYGQ